MALGTYSDLKGAVADWLERSDLTARIPDFISLAEVKLNRLFRGRMNEVNGPLTATPGTRTIALPAGFTEPVALWINWQDCNRELRFVDPALMIQRTDAGQPEYWTVEAGNLAFERACDQAYAFTLRYLRKFVLSDAEPTNWLLTEAPDVYLFGALLEAAPFLRDGDLLALFQAKFDAGMGELNAKESRNRAGSTLSVEPGLRQARRFNIITG